jgi:hypothetical protein
MLGAGKTISGSPLVPRWWAFSFGGNYRQLKAGYGWSPSVFRLIKRYYRDSELELK